MLELNSGSKNAFICITVCVCFDVGKVTERDKGKMLISKVPMLCHVCSGYFST